LPFRYEDRQHPRSLDELKAGEMASVIAEVRGTALLLDAAHADL
jgi:ATP-dependent DNA helicase RecG